MADTNNHKIQAFSAEGRYLTNFGGPGTQEYQFDYPAGLAIDQNGNVFVADRNNRRVQKYNKNGTFVLMFGAGVDTGAAVPEICTAACQIGLNSGADGGFSVVLGVAIGINQRVYVTDYNSNRVQVFSNSGVFITDFGETGDGALNHPVSVAVDPANNVYVGDAGNNRIVKYSWNGTFLRTWGWGVQDGSSEFQVCTSGCQPGTGGSGGGQINSPAALVADPLRAFIYVAEDGNSYVHEFSRDGSYMGQWGTYGTAPGQLNHPRGLAFDSRSYLYVAEGGNHRIQKFEYPMGTFVADRPALSSDPMPGYLSGSR